MVAGNSSAAFGLRVEVGDVTPGWYTSRIRVHRLHTGARLLASFQLKIEEVSPDWDVAVSRDSLSLAEADDPGTASAQEHQATYSVRLTEEPSGDVTVTPVSADASVAVVSQALTFTAANWQTPQAVTVTAVDDDVDNVGDRHASIRHDVGGAGSDDVMVDDVAVVVADDDARGVSVSAGSLALDEVDDPGTGGVLEHRGTYTVKLTSEPVGGDVTVGLASGDTTAATVSPATLTFTSTDWSTARTVTVTAVDDNTNTASVRQTSISHTVTSAGDYAGVAAADVSVTVGPLRSGPCPAAAGGDYDIDDDGLIEICNLAQLNAIRWDLNGDGAADVYPPDKNGFTGHDPDGAAKLAAAFPNAATGMGCPTGGCTGFELSADLDFDTNGNGRADTGDTYWNNGLGWHPLIGAEKIKSKKAHYRFRDHFVVGRISVCCGDRPNPRARMFTAEFEGNGRTIANLYINDPVLDYVGLFGIIGHGAHVRNVGLTAPNADSKVVGGARVGALAGDIERGRVSGVYSDLDVSGVRKVGGLAGSIWRFGFMIESYATGDVTGRSMAGGLLGILSGSGVAAVYATGDVTVALNEGGGLAGYRADGHLRAAYATGSVSYTGVHSSPGWRIGGLVGGYSHSWTESWMRANYATGRVSSPNAEITSGGLTGGCTLSKRERSEGANYWDVEATGMATSPDCGMGYTTAQLQAPTGYTGIYADWNVDVNVGYHGSFLGPGDDPWDFGTSTQYPVLKYCAEKPGIETPDGQPYCPLQPDNQRDPSSGQVETDSSPVVNVAAANNISEGQSAAFVIAANPNPSADLPVNVSVTAGGDYGVTAETKTVTIPADGSYTLNVATTNDSADEDDGTVTVTVNTGTGYTVSATSGAARVAVADNDVPEISIAAVDADIDEGGVAVFAVSAVPVPASPLSVEVSVAQSGDFGVSTGSRQVTVGTSGTGTLSVSTSGDSVDEANGSVTATVSRGSGYSVSLSARSASVAVRDDDECVVALSGDGSVSGRWAASCSSSARSGRYARFYTFSLDASSRVTVDLESSVDTYLYLRAGVGQKQGAVLESDDDGGDGYNSRIRRTLAAGDYTIEATTLPALVSGPFTLTVTVADDDVRVPLDDPCVVVLSGEGSVSGQWAAGCDSSTRTGSYALFYPFTLDASSQVTIDLVSSADTYLYLRAGSGRKSDAVLASDDDGGDGYNSRIRKPLAAGDYTIEATTFNPQRPGSFTLTVDGIPAQTVVQPDPEVEQDPEVSITAGAGVTEGGDAVFTVTAVPAPSAGLDVAVAVTAAGDFGVSPGSHTVTVPTLGSVTLTVATAGDAADEADGSVTATVAAGSGYTVSATAGAATVAVRDDDDAAPAVCVPSLPSDAVTVLEVTGWRDGHSGSAHVLRWNRVLAALGTDTGETPMTVEQSRANEGQFMLSRWDRVTRTLEALGQCDDNDPAPPPPPPDPEVSIAAGGDITEGGTAVFTVTADPAPSAALAVTVTVAQTGDYGATPGTHTVTIPTSGTATLTVTTINDSTDETDGSVTATVNTGTGYTVSATAGTAAVAVADDDPAPPPPPPPTADPEVSIAAGADIDEGGTAVFTITADPAPPAPLTVDVAVAQSGDFGVSPGSRTVTIPTSGTATLTVATTNDTTDEPDGSVTATVDAATGYTVSATAGAATVAIADDDNPPPPPPPPPSASKPTITVDDATAAEGDGAVEFTVRLSAAATSTVTVYYAANPGTAMPYADYRPDWGQITFAPGDTSKTVQVSLIDDRTPGEGDETLVLKLILTDTAHATLADNQAQGTITDND